MYEVIFLKVQRLAKSPEVLIFYEVQNQKRLVLSTTRWKFNNFNRLRSVNNTKVVSSSFNLALMLQHVIKLNATTGKAHFT